MTTSQCHSHKSAVTTAIVCGLMAVGVAGRLNAQPAISDQEAHDIGGEAFVYLYPLVTMDVTRRVMTNVPAGVKSGLGPANEFQHMRTYPPADMREVVRPNFDTLYSTAWLDLRKGPLVVSAPEMKGRYYLLPMLDMWSDAFAVPGKRTSGTAAAAFAVVPPGWHGVLPKGVQRIDAPTPLVWIIGRTQTNGPKDYEAVNKLQDGYTIIPLARWGKKPQPVKASIDPTVDMKTPPLDQVNKMPADAYFKYGAELMKTNPPHITDWSIIARLKRIGLEPGKFDPSALPPSAQAAVKQGAASGLKFMYSKAPTLSRVTNGWQMNTETMGVYGDYYLKRAIVAMVGLGANQALDAIYPLLVADADGKPLTGDNKYVLHFDREQLPPAGAFWSVTMYDGAGFQVANPLNRFALGDRDALKYNADGSLDLYLQNASPGTDKESNWLPSPAQGVLGVTMRIYAPKLPALAGTWNPPAVKRSP